jgi:esterase/lipase superfamily enzyme
VKETHHKWYSPSLSKEIDMLVYGYQGYPVILFPSSQGRYYESKDFGLVQTAEWFLDRGFIQIFCPDSVDAYSWYNKHTGASFGGFHAANFAFKHPDMVSHLFSMSGSFDIKSFMDGYYDDNVYFNNPVDFLPGLNHPDLWKMKIILGTSEWDICLEGNRTLSAILNNKSIDHWLDLRGWKPHDWPLWREMFPHYLSLL